MFGENERGVTSVMGNVLILVVVVVLASTVALSMFDTSDEATEEPPSADMDLSFDQGSSVGFGQDDANTAGPAEAERMTLTHNGGNGLKSLYVRIEVEGTAVRDAACLTFVGNTPSKLTSGDSMTVSSTDSCKGSNDLDSGDEVLVKYDDPNSEKAFVLTEGVVP